MKYIKKFENVDDAETLIHLTKANNTKDIKILINNGIDINSVDDKNNNALMYAAAFKRIEIVEILIKAGADVNMKNDNNKTAIIYASEDNVGTVTNKIIMMLIEAGADWNIIGNDGKYFLDHLEKTTIRQNIINLYPEKYKEYLMMKKAEKYNL